MGLSEIQWGQQCTNTAAGCMSRQKPADAWLHPCSTLARPGANRAAYSGPTKILFSCVATCPLVPKALTLCPSLNAISTMY